MNLNDTMIEMLTSKQVGKITIGMSPNKLPFVALEHQIKTGNNNDMMVVMHQREADSITECFMKIVKDMEHCLELQTKLIQIRK